MTDRIQSGLRLYQEGAVHINKIDGEDITFLVGSGDKVYEVMYLDGYWTCGCNDFFYRKVKEFDDLENFGYGVLLCKHVLACLFKFFELKGALTQEKII